MPSPIYHNEKTIPRVLKTLHFAPKSPKFCTHLSIHSIHRKRREVNCRVIGHRVIDQVAAIYIVIIRIYC